MYDQCVEWSYGDCYIEHMWVGEPLVHARLDS